MGEANIRCQFGQKKKDGKVVRSATCTNRASGAFRVFYKGRRPPRVMFLCAGCAFDKVPNHVAIIVREEGEPMYFRDVAAIELLVTFGTVFDQTGVARAEGYKWWVERTDELPIKKTIMEKVKVYPSRGPKMDINAYLNTLRRHDDGK